MTKLWQPYENYEFGRDYIEDFVLFYKEIDETRLDYQLRWRNGNRKIMTPALLRAFSTYLNKFAYKEPDEYGYAQCFVEDFCAFNKLIRNKENDSDDYFVLWAELYLSIEHLKINFRKFLNCKHAQKHKKNKSPKRETSKRKIWHREARFHIEIDPNAKVSNLTILDGRTKKWDFDLIRDFSAYLQSSAKKTEELAKTAEVILAASIAVGENGWIHKNRFDKAQHIKLWTGLYEVIIKNSHMVKRFRDWQRKTNARKKD